MHKVIELLSRGKFEKYNKKYHTALAYARGMRIPNNGFAAMCYFTQTIESYMKANFIKKIFIDPYSGFKNFVI